MMTTPFSLACLRSAVLGGLSACALMPAWAADPSEFSEAEKLVFVAPHLKNLAKPVT